MTTTTRLQACNAILNTIGENPVSSIEGGSDTAETTLALTCLDEIAREFQSEGWSFNTDIKVLYERDNDDKIPVGSNVAKIVPSYLSYYVEENPVIRGGFLWDRKNNTDVFTRDLYFDRVILLDFVDLPEPAKRYITLKAAQLFQARVQGDQVVHAITQQQINEAYAKFIQSENETENTSLLNSLAAYDVLSGFLR